MNGDRTVQQVVVPFMPHPLHSISFLDKLEAQTAINALSSCEEHNGVHHFAVTGEGKIISCSAAGMVCIEKALR